MSKQIIRNAEMIERILKVMIVKGIITKAQAKQIIEPSGEIPRIMHYKQKEVIE